MPWKNCLVTLSNRAAISWFDLIFLTLLMLGGLVYLHDCLHWGIGWVGETQYGDAEFWWDGALHIAHGLFQDNPGKGFRPGYFILSGLTLPVLGEQFKQFFPYLLLTFLTTAGLFYLALRQPFGRWAAACVVAMLVFNPFTAEWLATSTSDATGLILNMTALACLLLGVRNGLQRNWLIAFGVFFALATLTRPLVTPYIGVVLLLLLVFPRLPLKNRITMIFCVLLAFCLPTFAWMTIQKLTIDRWAISSNDASAFYAASDPAIQVWTPSMYDHVQQLAAQHYHIDRSKIDDQQLNQMFWLETLKNYTKYPHYHLKRLLPHVWQIAHFSPKMATQGTDHWRTALLEAIALGMLFGFLLQRRWMSSATFTVLSVGIYLSPQLLVAFMTLGGAAMALLLKRNQQNTQPAMFLLSAYWLTGVIALYLVGGTFGSPSFSSAFALNALGYRLGSQVFFVGDILAAYFLVWLAYFPSQQKFNIAITNNLALKWKEIICRSYPWAGCLVLGFFCLFLILTLLVYLIGSAIVIQRINNRHYAVIEPYPSLLTVLRMYQHQTNNNLIQGVGNKGGLSNVVVNNANEIFTGTASAFVWNLPGQQRAQLMVYTQNQVRPYTMGPNFIILEVPQHISVKDWSGVQGAFIIHQIADRHNLSNLPYFLTTPAILAFVPLNSDMHSFALAKTIWFPLTKNATQLETSGELKFQNAKVTWAQDSGSLPFQRRFFILPYTKNETPGNMRLLLNMTHVHGSATLSFAYAIGNLTSESVVTQPLPGYYDNKIFILRKGSTKPYQLLFNQEPVSLAGKTVPLKKVKLSIPANTQTIEITFNKIAPPMGIWIYEFNLQTTAVS